MCTKNHSSSPISLPVIACAGIQLWDYGEAEVKGHEKLDMHIINDVQDVVS